MQSNGHSLTADQLSRINLEELSTDGGPEFNRLIFEKSSYLLQHATNPIDWRPWTDATLKLALKLNKPIFLSIGYPTCHWCHVMAEESFSDDQIAHILNHDCIPIKVDREERPDIDATCRMATSLRATGQLPWF